MIIPKASLNNKTALITGGSSGIGKACAKLMAHTGAQVAILGRELSKLEAVIQETEKPEQHLALQADVSDETLMQRVFEKVRAQWNKLDIVVVNAGINGVWAPLEQIQVSDWDQILNTNLRGTFLTVKLALPLLRVEGGSIIIISSVNGTRIFSNTGATAYSCSKAAQAVFAKMVALELAKEKIRVNVVCPGATSTHIEESTVLKQPETIRVPVLFSEGNVPLNEGDPGTAGEVAQLIWFLASGASTHITGTEVYIDGGQSLLQG